MQIPMKRKSLRGHFASALNAAEGAQSELSSQLHSYLPREDDNVQRFTAQPESESRAPLPVVEDNETEEEERISDINECQHSPYVTNVSNIPPKNSGFHWSFSAVALLIASLAIVMATVPSHCFHIISVGYSFVFNLRTNFLSPDEAGLWNLLSIALGAAISIWLDSNFSETDKYFISLSLSVSREFESCYLKAHNFATPTISMVIAAWQSCHRIVQFTVIVLTMLGVGRCAFAIVPDATIVSLQQKAVYSIRISIVSAVALTATYIGIQLWKYWQRRRMQRNEEIQGLKHVVLRHLQSVNRPEPLESVRAILAEREVQMRKTIPDHTSSATPISHLWPTLVDEVTKDRHILTNVHQINGSNAKCWRHVIPVPM